MTAKQDAVITALVAQQFAARQQVQRAVLTKLTKLVRGMRGSWYDPKALDQFHTDASGLVRRGQVMTANASGAYVDRTLVALGAKPTSSVLTLPELLRDVPPEVEWERPAKEFRRLRVTGLAELEAQIAAELRAEQIATMDLALADREAARQRMQATGVTHYRRVFHPELSKSGSCGLCVVAADRTYSRDTLMPLHNGCNCTVLPAYEGDDPGLRLNTADLTAIYDAADGESIREKLQRVRVQVNDHGELGPILSYAGQDFRTDTKAQRDARA